MGTCEQGQSYVKVSQTCYSQAKASSVFSTYQIADRFEMVSVEKSGENENTIVY